GGVDEYLVLGDLVALGYDPIKVLQRLTSLPKVGFNRGNTDRYVVTGDRPAITDQAAVIEMPTPFPGPRASAPPAGGSTWRGVWRGRGTGGGCCGRAPACSPCTLRQAQTMVRG